MSRKIPLIIQQNPPMFHFLSIFHIWRHDLFRVESEAFQSAREGVLSSRMMGPCSITPVTNRILENIIVAHDPLKMTRFIELPDVKNELLFYG